MLDTVICYSALVIFGFWVICWMMVAFAKNTLELEKITKKELQAGRKVSFWVTPNGQTWAASIALISLLLWGAGVTFVSYYLDDNIFGVLFLSLALVVLCSLLIVVVSKIFGLGLANYKPSAEEVARAQKQIDEENRRARYYKRDDPPFFLP